MNILFEVLNGQVLKVENVKTNIQTATVKIYYDQEFHIKLTTDKSTISANGIDTATITAKIYDYQNNFIDSFASNISFEIDGNVQTVKASKGVSTISFSSSVVGEYEVFASVPNYRGASIKVVAE